MSSSRLKSDCESDAESCKSSPYKFSPSNLTPPDGKLKQKSIDSWIRKSPRIPENKTDVKRVLNFPSKSTDIGKVKRKSIPPDEKSTSSGEIIKNDCESQLTDELPNAVSMQNADISDEDLRRLSQCINLPWVRLERLKMPVDHLCASENAITSITIETETNLVDKGRKVRKQKSKSKKFSVTKSRKRITPNFHPVESSQQMSNLSEPIKKELDDSSLASVLETSAPTEEQGSFNPASPIKQEFDPLPKEPLQNTKAVKVRKASSKLKEATDTVSLKPVKIKIKPLPKVITETLKSKVISTKQTTSEKTVTETLNSEIVSTKQTVHKAGRKNKTKQDKQKPEPPEAMIQPLEKNLNEIILLKEIPEKRQRKTKKNVRGPTEMKEKTTRQESSDGNLNAQIHKITTDKIQSGTRTKKKISKAEAKKLEDPMVNNQTLVEVEIHSQPEENMPNEAEVQSKAKLRLRRGRIFSNSSSDSSISSELKVPVDKPSSRFSTILPTISENISNEESCDNTVNQQTEPSPKNKASKRSYKKKITESISGSSSKVNENILSTVMTDPSTGAASEPLKKKGRKRKGPEQDQNALVSLTSEPNISTELKDSVDKPSSEFSSTLSTVSENTSCEEIGSVTINSENQQTEISPALGTGRKNLKKSRVPNLTSSSSESSKEINETIPTKETTSNALTPVPLKKRGRKRKTPLEVPIASIPQTSEPTISTESEVSADKPSLESSSTLSTVSENTSIEDDSPQAAISTVNLQVKNSPVDPGNKISKQFGRIKSKTQGTESLPVTNINKTITQETMTTVTLKQLKKKGLKRKSPEQSALIPETFEPVHSTSTVDVMEKQNQKIYPSKRKKNAPPPVTLDQIIEASSQPKTCEKKKGKKDISLLKNILPKSSGKCKKRKAIENVETTPFPKRQKLSDNEYTSTESDQQYCQTVFSNSEDLVAKAMIKSKLFSNSEHGSSSHTSSLNSSMERMKNKKDYATSTESASTLIDSNSECTDQVSSTNCTDPSIKAIPCASTPKVVAGNTDSSTSGSACQLKEINESIIVPPPLADAQTVKEGSLKIKIQLPKKNIKKEKPKSKKKNEVAVHANKICVSEIVDKDPNPSLTINDIVGSASIKNESQDILDKVPAPKSVAVQKKSTEESSDNTRSGSVISDKIVTRESTKQQKAEDTVDSKKTAKQSSNKKKSTKISKKPSVSRQVNLASKSGIKEDNLVGNNLSNFENFTITILPEKKEVTSEKIKNCKQIPVEGKVTHYAPKLVEVCSPDCTTGTPEASPASNNMLEIDQKKALPALKNDKVKEDSSKSKKSIENCKSTKKVTPNRQESLEKKHLQSETVSASENSAISNQTEEILNKSPGFDPVKPEINTSDVKGSQENLEDLVLDSALENLDNSSTALCDTTSTLLEKHFDEQNFKDCAAAYFLCEKLLQQHVGISFDELIQRPDVQEGVEKNSTEDSLIVLPGYETAEPFVQFLKSSAVKQLIMADRGCL